MSQTATAISVPPVHEYGRWGEGLARTDSGSWTLTDELKELVSANTDTDEDGRAIIQTASSTLPVKDRDAESRFETIFQNARELQFEDGIETEFSREMIALVKAYGPMSRDILARLFEDKRMSPEVLSEALRWLGRMDDEPSYETRLWLLERGLTSPAALVRDGATLGLASMDDPRAIPYLSDAIHSEKLTELRKDMEQVLAQLKNNR